MQNNSSWFAAALLFVFAGGTAFGWMAYPIFHPFPEDQPPPVRMTPSPSASYLIPITLRASGSETSPPPRETKAFSLRYLVWCAEPAQCADVQKASELWGADPLALPWKLVPIASYGETWNRLALTPQGSLYEHVEDQIAYTVEPGDE